MKRGGLGIPGLGGVLALGAVAWWQEVLQPMRLAGGLESAVPGRSRV